MEAARATLIALLSLALIFTTPPASAGVTDTEEVVGTVTGVVDEAVKFVTEFLEDFPPDQCVNPFGAPVSPCQPQDGRDYLKPVWRLCTSNNSEDHEACLDRIKRFVDDAPDPLGHED